MGGRTLRHLIAALACAAFLGSASAAEPFLDAERVSRNACFTHPVELEHAGLSLRLEGARASIFERHGRPSRIRIDGGKLRIAYAPPATPRFAALRAQLAASPERASFDARSLTIDGSPLRVGAFARLLEPLETCMDARPEPVASLARLPPPDGRDWIRLVFERPDGSHLAWSEDDSASREIRVADDMGAWLQQASDAHHPGLPDADSAPYTVQALRGRVTFDEGPPAALTADLTLTLQPRRTLHWLPLTLDGMGRSGDEEGALTVVPEPPQRWFESGPRSGYLLLGRPQELPFELTLSITHRDAFRRVSPSAIALPRENWLPFVRADDPIRSFQLELVTPNDWNVVATGEQVGDPEPQPNGTHTLRRFKAGSPAAFPTVALGKFEPYRAAHAAVPTTLWIDETGRIDWGLKPERLQQIADEARRIVETLSAIFGAPYPYASLDLVHDPLRSFHGQSPASVVYLGSFALRDEPPAHESWSALAEGTTRSILSHEIAHQWWGCRFTAANRHEYWLIESLAEYASALYEERVEGVEFPANGRRAYRRRVERWRAAALADPHRTAIVDAAAIGTDDFRGAAYARGPLFLHNLRRRLGDGMFFGLLPSLAAHAAERPLTTEALQRLAEAQHGKPLEGLFASWLETPGIPSYAIAHDVERRDGKWLISGSVSQSVSVGDLGELEGVYLEADLPLRVLSRKGARFDTTVRLRTDSPTTEFEIELPFRPEQVLWDAERDGVWNALDAGS